MTLDDYLDTPKKMLDERHWYYDTLRDELFEVDGTMTPTGKRKPADFRLDKQINLEINNYEIESNATDVELKYKPTPLACWRPKK